MKHFYVFSVLYLCIRGTISDYTTTDSQKHATTTEFLDNSLDSENIISDDSETPLILTTLINEGKIKEAQAAARVTRFQQFDNIESYSGFFTIDKKFESHLYFWFFPSKRDYVNAPVILWLQGGPGSSSLNGLFYEHGPFELDSNNNLRLREHPWTDDFSVIYLDNPVESGFSFSKKNGYAENQTAVGNGVCAAMVQFFKLFPELKHNDFFIAGESYAGKYIPASAHTIHHHNLKSDHKINLKGLAIGGGLYEPISQFYYSDVLYQTGFIDFNAKDEVSKLEDEFKDHIKKGEWAEAYYSWATILNKFRKYSGYKALYNYMKPTAILYDYDLLTEYLNDDKIKSTLHVGKAAYTAQSIEAHAYLMTDVMKSITPWLSEVLNYYRVLIYNGQLDIMVPYPSTEEFLKNFDFSGAEEYKSAQRFRWYVGDEIAGYGKCGGNLTEILVRNAGHSLPGDRPVWVLELIKKFTANKLISD